MFFTLRHQVPKLTGQQHLSRVLVQDFGEGLFGSQAAEHHCVVLVHRGQAMQEAEQLLNNLSPEPQRLMRGKQGQAA